MIHLEPDLHRLERFAKWIIAAMLLTLLAAWLVGEYLPMGVP